MKDSFKLPENVKKWPEISWKKYFYRYIVSKNLCLVHPMISMKSNYGDKGVHYVENINVLQGPLDYRDNHHDFVFEGMGNSRSVYDANFEFLPSCYRDIGADEIKDDVLVDLYGTKQMEVFNESEWLTSKYTNKKIKKFSDLVFPLEENISRGQIQFASAPLRASSKTSWGVR